MTEKISFKFNPEDLTGLEIPKGKKKEAAKEIARAVQDYILDYVGDGKSPVSGGPWKRQLSKEYAKKKEDESGINFANLELSGALMDALETKIHSDGSIEVGIFKPSEVGKADGHNNFSGESKLPTRQFIPKKDQTFKREISEGIKDIIKEYQND